RDDGPDDHLARIHQEALPLSCSRAASVTTSEVAPITSATPAASASATVTPVMFLKLFATFSSSEAITTSVGPSAPHFRSASAACWVAGPLKPAPSGTATVPGSAWTERAARSALRRALRFPLTV